MHERHASYCKHSATFITLSWLAYAGACTFSSKKPEMFLPDSESDAGRAPDSSDLQPVAPSGGSSGGAAAAVSTTTSPVAGKTSSAATSGSGGSSGSAPTSGAGVGGSPPSNAGSGSDFDAGAPDDPSTIDAGAPAIGELPTDLGEAYACAAALTLCLIDFANYTECVRTTAGPCGLPHGGVTIPSPECAQKLSECVQQHPDRAQECNEMLATCI